MSPIHSGAILISSRATLTRHRAAFALAASCAAIAACNSSSSSPTPATADSTGSVAAASAASPAASATGAAPASTSVLDHALSFLTGGPFEGDIAMTTTRDGKPPLNMTFEVKGQKVRFTMASTRGDVDYVIVDYSTKQAITVSDAKQTAMAMSLDGIMTGMGTMGAPKTPVHPVATGQTSVIAGYSCAIYKADVDTDKDEACLAKGIRFPQMDPRANRWLADIGDGDLFPLRTVKVDATGKEKMRMEVTKIDRKSLPDSVFAPPLGYKVVTMDDMMKAHGRPH